MTGLDIAAAQYLFLLPVAILALYFFRQPSDAKRRMAIFAGPSLLLTYLAGLLGNRLYLDPRPFVIGHFTPLIPHTPDNGFPSDHTLLVASLAALGCYWNATLGVALWVLAAVVAVARVAVGLHHPIDVIGSIVIAVVVTSGVYLFLKHVRHRSII
jgi:undecaprenyl-diphosphatase